MWLNRSIQFRVVTIEYGSWDRNLFYIRWFPSEIWSQIVIYLVVLYLLGQRKNRQDNVWCGSTLARSISSKSTQQLWPDQEHSWHSVLRCWWLWALEWQLWWTRAWLGTQHLALDLTNLSNVWSSQGFKLNYKQLDSFQRKIKAGTNNTEQHKNDVFEVFHEISISEFCTTK